MIAYPTGVSEGRGGTSFKKSKGKGKVVFKCEEELQMPTPVEFCISVSGTKPRGPVSNDFSTSAVCGLPPDQEEWDFLSLVDPNSSAVTVCLELHSCHAHDAPENIRVNLQQVKMAPAACQGIVYRHLVENELRAPQRVKSTPASELPPPSHGASDEVMTTRMIASRQIDVAPNVQGLCVQPMLSTLHNSEKPMDGTTTPPPGLELPQAPATLGAEDNSPNFLCKLLPPNNDCNVSGGSPATFFPQNLPSPGLLPKSTMDAVLPLLTTDALDWWAARLTWKAHSLLRLAATKKEMRG